MKPKSTYYEILPSEDLSELIDSFWNHENLSDQPEEMTIFPDSYAKIIFVIADNKIQRYFFTGIWTEQKEFSSPPHSQSIGCRLKILAPEFLFNQSFAPLIDSVKQLELGFLNIERFDLKNFETLVDQ